VTLLPARAPYWLWSALWSLRRRLGLSPTQEVFREIQRRGVRTREKAAVEVFAGTGFRHTIDYHPFVGTLEVWEVNPAYEATLRRNLPGAAVRITDSFEEVRLTARRFGIIVVDNTITTFGKGYVEHLDLFPDIFRLADDSCVLLLNVCPQVPEPLRTDAVRMSRRASFYRSATPHDIPIERMVEVYAQLMADHGFRLAWHFERRRAHRDGIHYLAMGLSRTVQPPAGAPR
jgi:hypothetical protein